MTWLLSALGLGSAQAIGAQVFMGDVGPSVVLTDNATWLRSGVLASAASAPRLATIAAYRALGKAVTTPPGTTLLQIATDGAGTYVATGVSPTNAVWRSTDGGVTWAQVNLPVPMTAGGIVYTGTRFIVVGALTGGGMVMYYSTTGGATWAGGTTSSAGNAGGTVYGAISRGVWAGTKAVFLVPCAGGAGPTNAMLAFTTTDGTAFTLFNAGNAMGVGSIDPHMGSAPILLSNGAAGVLAVNATVLGYTSYLWSTDSGTSWTAYTAPAGGNILGAAVAGTKLAFALAGFVGTPGSLFVVTAPNTLLAAVPCTPINLTGVYSNGAKFFGYCATSQTVCELAADHLSLAAVRSTISGATPQPSGDRVFQFSAVGNYYGDINWTVYDYVGIPVLQRSSAASNAYLYVRAK